jgi:hypothetical protein
MQTIIQPPPFQKPEGPTPPQFPIVTPPRQKMRLRIPAKILIPFLVIAGTAALVGLMQSLSPRYERGKSEYDRILEGPQSIEWGRINGGNFTYEVEFSPQHTDPTAVVVVYFLRGDQMNYYELTAAQTGEITLNFIERGIRKTLPLSGLQTAPSFDNGMRFRIVRSLGDDIQVYLGDNIIYNSVNVAATWGSFGVEQQGSLVAGYKLSLRQQM